MACQYQYLKADVSSNKMARTRPTLPALLSPSRVQILARPTTMSNARLILPNQPPHSTLLSPALPREAPPRSQILVVLSSYARAPPPSSTLCAAANSTGLSISTVCPSPSSNQQSKFMRPPLNPRHSHSPPPPKTCRPHSPPLKQPHP